MANCVEVNTIENDSVSKKIEKTAKKLSKKFKTKRKVNEKILKQTSSSHKVFSIIFDCLCSVIVVFSAMLCFSYFNSCIQNICPTFAGYSNLTIKSSSMVKSGFEIGDTVIVHSVDTDTLHINDKIAFYVYSKDYLNFNVNSCIAVRDEDIGNLNYTTSFGSLFGIQSNSIRTAAKSGSALVFHHIRAIYEDETGVRWFKTYGSSNDADDSWYISEKMIVGAYDDSNMANVFSVIISTVASYWGVLIILIPIILLSVTIIMECIKDITIVKLELDCVEEKRKITDAICVKNDVGFNMDTKTKYKILAQAPDNEKNEYISLLWRNGSAPNNVRKYYIRKKLLLKYDEELLAVNRKCEEMYKEGVADKKIAKYYLTEKERILNKHNKIEKRLKMMSKKR